MLLPRMLAAALALALLPAFALAAPLGRSFTYQGELSQAGTPIDGTVDLRFSLWDAASGGTQVGSSQIAPAVPVHGGLFTVLVNAADEFGAQAFVGQARWLRIEVCADASCASTTVLEPRQPLTAAPFALGPWQSNGTSVGYTQGHAGIGTTSPDAPLHLQRTGPYMVLQDMAANSQQAGYLGFWNSSGAETGWVGFGSPGSPDFTVLNNRSGGGVRLWAGGAERVSILSTGRVGLGTSAPVAKLDVRGDIKHGPNGEYFTVGSTANLSIVRGVVSNAGTRVFGSGFTSSRTSTGIYQITFDAAFVDQPTIIATCRSTADRIAVVSSHLAGSCTVRVVNGSGTLVDNYFDILAIGLR
jgi:hypothetical protein